MGLAGPIGRVGRACGGGFGVLKDLQLINIHGQPVDLAFMAQKQQPVMNGWRDMSVLDVSCPCQVSCKALAFRTALSRPTR